MWAYILHKIGVGSEILSINIMGFAYVAQHLTQSFMRCKERGKIFGSKRIKGVSEFAQKLWNGNVDFALSVKRK